MKLVPVGVARLQESNPVKTMLSACETLCETPCDMNSVPCTKLQDKLTL